jgi:DNA-damage-inducible protein D
MKILPTDFDGQAIRRVYDESTETWWFSVIDVVQVLTDSTNANRYWSDLKRKLAQEAGSEQPYEKIVRLKLTAPDGKQRETDCATAETLLRVVQAVPSPKAEPIKLWLAKVGYERMQEMADPALSLARARQTWQQHGRSDKWIQQRMTGQETRNKLTDYWSEHDIKAGSEFAILTNIIHQEWAGLSVAQHKAKKGLTSHNLRDHMSEAELIFTALAELSTRQIAESVQATGMAENKTAATTGGRIARQARNQLEAQTGSPVVTGANYLPPATPAAPTLPNSKAAKVAKRPQAAASPKKP